MEIKQAIIPVGRKRRPQIAMKPTYITIHNTGCPNVPADNFRRSCHDITQDKEVGFHLVVDEKECIQLIPFNEVAWHAGDGRKNGNMKSIGIEVCEREGAEENVIEVVRQLMKEFNIPIENVRTHKSWSGKECPRLILPHWNEFIEAIKDVNQTREIKIELNGKEKYIPAIELNGNNYVRLQDLRDDKISIGYDSVRKIPIVTSK